MLSDLFRRLRPSEPIKVLVFRRFVVIISLAFLVIIFVILCMGVNDELPSIKTTFKEVNSLPAPGENNFFKLNI